MAFASKSVTVSVSAGHILLTVDGETTDVDPAWARQFAHEGADGQVRSGIAREAVR